MRPRVTAAMSGLSLVVLGLSLRASEQHTVPATSAAPAGVVGEAPATPQPRLTSALPPAKPSARAPTKTGSSAPRPSTSPTPSTVTVNGAPADTQYGPVQVQITLRGGHLVHVDAIDYPNSGGRDQEINSHAIPQLDDEAMQADGAQVDTVSGATYTSDGYRRSLQSALDAAHRAGAR